MDNNYCKLLTEDIVFFPINIKYSLICCSAFEFWGGGSRGASCWRTSVVVSGASSSSCPSPFASHAMFRCECLDLALALPMLMFQTKSNSSNSISSSGVNVNVSRSVSSNEIEIVGEHLDT